MTRARPAWIASALLAAVVVGGCKPSVCFFRANPNVACRSTPVRLTWGASSGGRIASTPSDPHGGQVGAEGSRLVAPQERTRYRLYAINTWGHAQVDIDVDVITGPESLSLATSTADPSMQCEDDNGAGSGTVSVTIDAPRTAWDPHLLAREVAIAPHVTRPYHVEHGNVAADLAPGAPSRAFAALPVQGAWRISTPLLAGESCQNLPRSMLLDVVAACWP
jgi:hypothetical protein